MLTLSYVPNGTHLRGLDLESGPECSKRRFRYRLFFVLLLTVVVADTMLHSLCCGVSRSVASSSLRFPFREQALHSLAIATVWGSDVVVSPPQVTRVFLGLFRSFVVGVRLGGGGVPDTQNENALP